jgi:hypothetical protein
MSATSISSLTALIAGLFLITLSVSTQSAQPESDLGTWRTAAPMPTKRMEVAAAALDERLQQPRI